MSGPHPAVLVTNAGLAESGDAATVTFPTVRDGWTKRPGAAYFRCVDESPIGLYVEPGDPYIEIGEYRFTAAEAHRLAARLTEALAIQASAP